jgi:hypothetical protein
VEEGGRGAAEAGRRVYDQLKEVRVGTITKISENLYRWEVSKGQSPLDVQKDVRKYVENGRVMNGFYRMGGTPDDPVKRIQPTGWHDLTLDDFMPYFDEFYPWEDRNPPFIEPGEKFSYVDVCTCDKFLKGKQQVAVFLAHDPDPEWKPHIFLLVKDETSYWLFWHDQTMRAFAGRFESDLQEERLISLFKDWVLEHADEDRHIERHYETIPYLYGPGGACGDDY